MPLLRYVPLAVGASCQYLQEITLEESFAGEEPLQGWVQLRQTWKVVAADAQGWTVSVELELLAQESELGAKLAALVSRPPATVKFDARGPEPGSALDLDGLPRFARHTLQPGDSWILDDVHYQLEAVQNGVAEIVSHHELQRPEEELSTSLNTLIQFALGTGRVVASITASESQWRSGRVSRLLVEQKLLAPVPS